MEEMIPLSANIFHTKGDHQARAVAAIDIVIACLPHVFTGPEKRNIATEIAMELQGMLMPGGYDVRGELASALRGDDTAAPKEAGDGNGPVVVGFDKPFGVVVGVFSSVSAALSAGALFTEEMALDSPKK
jgi:hypothetical protein